MTVGGWVAAAAAAAGPPGKGCPTSPGSGRANMPPLSPTASRCLKPVGAKRSCPRAPRPSPALWPSLAPGPAVPPGASASGVWVQTLSSAARSSPAPLSLLRLRTVGPAAPGRRGPGPAATPPARETKDQPVAALPPPPPPPRQTRPFLWPPPGDHSAKPPSDLPPAVLWDWTGSPQGEGKGRGAAAACSLSLALPQVGWGLCADLCSSPASPSRPPVWSKNAKKPLPYRTNPSPPSTLALSLS